MTGPLAGIREKVLRADDHLNLLKSEAAIFVSGKPYEAVANWETPTRLVVRFHVLQEPPPRLGVILGDFVHNLRSALDHLVWQLVIVSGNQPGRHNTFPIYPELSGWNADVAHRQPGRGPSPLEGLIKGWTEIEALQPFHGTHPRFDPLAVLNHLSRTDKHRLLVPTYLALADSPLFMDPLLYEALRDDPAIPRGVMREVGVLRNHDEPLEDGTDLMTLNFPHSQDTEMEVQLDCSPVIAFGEVRPGLTFDRLQFIRERVALTVQLFEQFF